MVPFVSDLHEEPVGKFQSIVPIRFTLAGWPSASTFTNTDLQLAPKEANLCQIISVQYSVKRENPHMKKKPPEVVTEIEFLFSY